MADIERMDGKLSDMDHERSMLYSQSKGDRVSYLEKVQEMDSEYRDLMFSLSRHNVMTKSGELITVGTESIRTVKDMTFEEILEYSRRMNANLKGRSDG